MEFLHNCCLFRSNYSLTVYNPAQSLILWADDVLPDQTGFITACDLRKRQHLAFNGLLSHIFMTTVGLVVGCFRDTHMNVSEFDISRVSFVFSVHSDTYRPHTHAVEVTSNTLDSEVSLQSIWRLRNACITPVLYMWVILQKCQKSSLISMKWVRAVFI